MQRTTLARPRASNLNSLRRGRARRGLSLPWVALALAASLAGGCRSSSGAPDYTRPLPDGADALLELSKRDPWPDFASEWKRRDEILSAVELSVGWTKKEWSEQYFPAAGIDHERALQSLLRFRELLETTASAEEFDAALRDEFTVYKSAGWDGRGGGVLYTGYCTPELAGSLEPNTVYRYPLYALPPDLVKGDEGEILGQDTPTGLRPYPTRGVIEASGMLGSRGLELVYLADPIDAYIAHVNGSAFIRLRDGELFRLGYSGKNGRPYSSLGKALIADEVLDAETVNLKSIRDWAKANPSEVQEYLDRNESYVFFTPIKGTPRGSLNLPVTPGRTLATDKTLFPRGAVVFVETQLPGAAFAGGGRFHRFLLDQDTGGAIRTAGRADIYLGVGAEAERQAGTVRCEGQLYYLFLKE